MSEHVYTVREKVMKAIETEAVTMRPRWHYVLFSALVATGTTVLLLGLLYVVSLVVFFLRESGVWFAPAFGVRGWWEFARALPMMLVVLVLVFVVLLELVARHYSFVYRRPFLVSVVGILAVVFFGGFLVEGTMIHHQLQMAAQRHMLPPPVSSIYQHSSRAMRPAGLFRGVVYASTTDGIIVSDIEGEGSTTVVITRDTQLPDGAAFSVGDDVVIVGDEVREGTIKAYGMRIVKGVDKSVK